MNKTLRIFTLYQILQKAPVEMLDYMEVYDIEERTFKRYIQFLNQYTELQIEHELGCYTNIAPPSTQDVCYELFEQQYRLSLVSVLMDAIRQSRQILVEQYTTSNKEQGDGKTLEPIRLTKDLKTLIAFDLERKETRSYKLARMTDVELLAQPNCQQKLYTSLHCDTFGMNATRLEPLTATFKPLAFKLLNEEFFLEEQQFNFQKKEAGYLVTLRVAKDKYQGFYRFYKGLEDQILLTPETQEKIDNWLQKVEKEREGKS